MRFEVADVVQRNRMFAIFGFVRSYGKSDTGSCFLTGLDVGTMGVLISLIIKCVMDVHLNFCVLTSDSTYIGVPS